MVNEEANKDLDMFRYTIKRRSHVDFQKMKIESAWSDSLSQYNSTYKLLIERLEEKLAQFDTEKISKKDMSTQTGKISIVCLLTISKFNMVNEEANKDLDMFRYTIKRRSHVDFQKMKIESAWSDSLS